MSSYHVMFDDEWQKGFSDRTEALEWAKEAVEPGRIVLVARIGKWRNKLVAVFPESQHKEGKRLWEVQRAVAEKAVTIPPGAGRDESGLGF